MREAHLLEAEIADGGAEGGVVHREAYQEPEREQAVDDALAEGRRLGILGVEVDGGGVHGQGAEQQVVGLGHGAPYRVLEALSRLELLEVESRHGRLRNA